MSLKNWFRRKHTVSTRIHAPELPAGTYFVTHPEDGVVGALPGMYEDEIHELRCSEGGRNSRLVAMFYEGWSKFARFEADAAADALNKLEFIGDLRTPDNVIVRRRISNEEFKAGGLRG